jgi:protein TonB
MISLKKALFFSLGLHLVGLFGGGFFLRQIELKKKKIIYPIHLIEIAESSPKSKIRPPAKKKTRKAPKPEKPKIVQKTVPKKPLEPKKGIPIKKEEKKKEVIKEKDEKKQAKQDIKQPDKDKIKEEKLSQAIEEIKKNLALKEKKELSYISKEFIEKQLQIYAAFIDRKIKENWSIPKTFLTDMGDFEAVVIIRIKPNGKLSDARLEKRSGFHPFDESTLRAIKKAAPFPVPPVDLKGEELEFEIRFYSDQMG